MPSYNQQAINLIWNELSSRGVKPEVAAGVIAGIMGESGASLDPTAFNTQDPHGGAGGILQWNDDRLIGDHGLLAFAKANGVNVDTNTPTDSKKVPLAIQVKFMGHELDGRYNGVLKGLQSVSNGEEGLNTWVDNMEAPLDKAGAKAQRRQYIAPVSGLLGKPAPAGADTATAAAPAAAAAATGALPAYQPPSPMQTLGSMLGQAFTGMGGGGGGGAAPIQDAPDQPAIRSMAAMTDFMQPTSPLPAQYSGGGVASQLGMLSAQPGMSPLENPAEAPSITQGAPSMTSMLGALGTTATPGLFDGRGGNPLSPNPYRSTMRLA